MAFKIAVYIQMLCLALCGMVVQAQDSANQTVITVYTAPMHAFFTLNDDGTFSGEGVDVVTEALSDLNLSPKFKYTHWNRAVTDALTQPNVILWGYSRTKATEDNFHWISLMGYARYSLLARKGTNIPSSIEAINAQGITIACPQNTTRCSRLTEMGFGEDLLVSFPESDIVTQVNMMLRGRFDLIISSKEMLAGLQNNNPDIAAQIQVADWFTFEIPFYVVLSKHTDRDLASKIVENLGQALGSHD